MELPTALNQRKSWALGRPYLNSLSHLPVKNGTSGGNFYASNNNLFHPTTTTSNAANSNGTGGGSMLNGHSQTLHRKAMIGGPGAKVGYYNAVYGMEKAVRFPNVDAQHVVSLPVISQEKTSLCAPPAGNSQHGLMLNSSHPHLHQTDGSMQATGFRFPMGGSNTLPKGSKNTMEYNGADAENMKLRLYATKRERHPLQKRDSSNVANLDIGGISHRSQPPTEEVSSHRHATQKGGLGDSTNSYQMSTSLWKSTGTLNNSQQASNLTNKSYPTQNNNNNNSVRYNNSQQTRKSHAQQRKPSPPATKRHISMNPHDILAIYRTKLTAYEQEEILAYPDVWFIGAGAKKIEAVEGGSINGGYDDENGAYLKVTNDHIAYRYEALNTLGRGSFGQVVRAIDHSTGAEVAIKIIRNKKRFHQQGAVEVRILDALKRCSPGNVVNIIDHFNFRNHLCIVFELLGMNLYDVLKKNGFRGFGMPYLKKIARTLLECLSDLRRERIIHCDLKPENILILSKNNHDIKVIDFGSSCYEHQKLYTYIQSRFYRAPEIILGIPYTMAIDMWSLGCVMAELFTGYPLLPGENEAEQLACIMELRGMPPNDILDQATRRRVFFDSKGNPRELTNSKGKKHIPGTKDLPETLRCNASEFINFIERCLEWNPAKRLTPEEGLSHSWLSEDYKLPALKSVRSSVMMSSESTPESKQHSMRYRPLQKHASNPDTVTTTTTGTTTSSTQHNRSAPRGFQATDDSGIVMKENNSNYSTFRHDHVSTTATNLSQKTSTMNPILSREDYHRDNSGEENNLENASLEQNPLKMQKKTPSSKIRSFIRSPECHMNHEVQ